MEKIKAYGVLLYIIEKKTTKILLCKSVKSLNKWGCLKGMQDKLETARECAKREFFEECAIKIETYLFEDFFYQENSEKDVGIWIVNANKIKDLEKYFLEDKLYDNYLSWENSKVKFFDINALPIIRKKQAQLVEEIKDFLQSKNQSR